MQFSPEIIGDELGSSCYNLGIDGYSLDMQLEYFYNAQHMNVRGAELFSRELAAGLAEIHPSVKTKVAAAQ